MPHTTSLLTLLCSGFVLALALGLLARRLRLSPLVGYLLAGVLVGPFTPGFVADQTLAPQLAEIGVILLMFGVGLHFSPRDLLSVRGVAIPGALVQICVAGLLGTLLGYAIGWPLPGAVVFGLALAVSSTVVVLRSLEERRLLDTPRGQIAVGWLVMQDLAMVLALVLLPALAGQDTASSPPHLFTAIATTLAKVAAFIGFMLVVGRRVLPSLLAHVAGLGSRELFTLAVLAIALGVAYAASTLFGVSFALGAFFAGILLNESELSHKAAADSLPMRDAFAVLFFVSVGMLFDPSVLLAQPLLVLATLIAIVLGNGLVSAAMVHLRGLPNATALTIGVSLAQIGEFSFILAGLGRGLGILPALAHDLILAGALLSILINPLLVTLLEAWQRRLPAAQATSSLHAPNVAIPDDLAGHVIVVGYGRVGRELVHQLQRRGIPLVLIEADGERVAQARALGIPTVRGNAADPAVLQEARGHAAHLAILAVPQALEAGEVITRLKAANPQVSVLARAHGQAEVRYLLERGADAAVLAERELAHSLIEMIMATPPYRAPRAAPPAA
ncbi:YbaL family putative K(+) efflux transporter [Thermomonas alba]|uniref:YbaL family putative K(+) efflux transporter n=1 Tax=Thermomonas alba TaxID=2888525 RepID=UPI001F03A245|nr:YbaL family putative K(+) efflux transporter [Thermomonas alba]